MEDRHALRMLEETVQGRLTVTFRPARQRGLLEDLVADPRPLRGARRPLSANVRYGLSPSRPFSSPASSDEAALSGERCPWRGKRREPLTDGQGDALEEHGAAAPGQRNVPCHPLSAHATRMLLHGAPSSVRRSRAPESVTAQAKLATCGRAAAGLRPSGRKLGAGRPTVRPQRLRRVMHQKR